MKGRLLRRVVWVLVILLGLGLLLVVLGGVWLRGRLLASLPQLDGESPLAGLTAEVLIERDALGIPTVRGANRLDVARATGFLHAQDRFFQMDLLRRQAAGELAEIFGPALLEADRALRLHRFRDVARRVIATIDAEGRALLEGYSDGVNAGLAALDERPFEYLLLQIDPSPWLPEDSILVIFAMFLELHDEDGSRESNLGLMHDILPEPLFEFLAPRGTEWDAPIVGEPFEVPPIPGPEVLDMRAARSGSAESEARGRAGTAPRALRSGSNNWAVAGSHTASNGALLANDMHLPLAVPNIWYRASFVWPADGGGGGERNVTGVTLPGIPFIVVGSNTQVAWGFTNSYGDWNDLVVLDVDPSKPDLYSTPSGPRRFDVTVERIRVKGQEDDETLEITSTIWGPIVDVDHHERPRALRWLAHDPEAVNLNLRHLESARTLDEAMEVANRSGIPAQNFVVADAGGRIGWTIIGIIPRRFGLSGRLPTSWADGSRGWDGWLRPAEYQRVIDPPSGRVWTANARVVDGAMLERIGDGGYDLGARAAQIRDALFALEKATVEEMRRIQLDDRALFFERWQNLLLEVLDKEAIAADPRRAEMRRHVEEWEGRAAVGSVGFRLVRAFRSFLTERLFDALTAPCKEADSRFSYGSLRQREGPVWRLVSERPPHFLEPQFETWDELFLSVVDGTLDYFTQEGGEIAESTWGRRNTTRIQHPLSLAVPYLGRWLDMPPLELPGASIMPRVQGPTYGASERMVVSPGREEEGMFHMPGGQSGHPLSPHYRDGHEAWARGEATPFLPGPSIHTLRLIPTPSVAAS